LPTGAAAKPTDPELAWEARVREVSKAAGLTETYSYSFVSKDLMAKAGFDTSHMLHVQNPLTAEFEAMRTTLLPSLLQVASDNRERFAEQRLFEAANVYFPTSEGWTDLPDEQLELGALFMGMGEPWRVAKGYVEHVLAFMGMGDKVGWKRLSKDGLWHPGRTVQAFHDGKLIATVGEISPKVAKAFKLDAPVGMAHMPLEHVIEQASLAKAYAPVSPFPEAKRDLAVIVDHRVEYDDVARQIRRTSPLVTAVEWFDTYRGPNLPEGKKSLAMHLCFSSPERTLESAEVDALMQTILLGLKEHFAAEARS
jgi:phenylalanyl-tRNA synthetase beta chain